jgi:uncharacterized protein (TIRG00374 family)
VKKAEQTGNKSEEGRRDLRGGVLRVVVTLGVLTVLIVKLDWSELWAHLVMVNAGWLAVAGLLFGLTFVFAAMRWFVLLQIQKVLVPFRVPLALTLIGQFFNVLLIGSMGGDVARIYYLARAVPLKKTPVVLSVVMDRVLGFGILLSLAVGASLLQYADFARREETQRVVLFLAITLGVLLLVLGSFYAVSLRHLPAFVQRLWNLLPWNDVVGRGVHLFREYGRQPVRTGMALLYSLATQLTVAAAGYCIAQAIHVETSYAQMVVVLAVVISVVSLPISIGGHGVREGMFVLMFTILGIRALGGTTSSVGELAVLFSVLFLVVQLGWSVVGGLVYLLARESAILGHKIKEFDYAAPR